MRHRLISFARSWSLAVSGEGRETQSALLPSRQRLAVGRAIISAAPLDLNQLLRSTHHGRIVATLTVGDVVTQPGTHLQEGPTPLHTPSALSASGRIALAVLTSALLVACIAGCGAQTTYKTYHFCICHKGSNHWKAGEQLSLTWLAQDDGTSTDPTAQPVTLIVEVHGPFAVVVPSPTLDQVRRAPLLLASRITTSDRVSQDQIATAQVPSTVQAGDYIMVQTTTMGNSRSSFNGWTEFHSVTIAQ